MEDNRTERFKPLDNETVKNEDLHKNHTFISTNQAKDTIATRYEQIPGECEILFPTQNWDSDKEKWVDSGSYSVRLIRNVPGARSIFEDEQSERSQASRAKPITITSDILLIPGSDINRLKYLRLAGFNKNNSAMRKPGTSVLYREVKKDEEAQEEVESSKNVDIAKAKVHQLTDTEIEAYALALSDNYKTLKSIEETETAILRRDLRAKASKNPEPFLKGLKSTKMKMRYVILKAANLGLLEIDDKGHKIKWSDGDVLIDSGPAVDPVDNLCELAQEEQGYSDILDDLMNKVKKEIKTDLPGDDKKEEAKGGSLINNLIEEGLSKGVIERSGPYFQYGDIKEKGKKPFIEKLQADQDTFLELWNKVSD